MRNVDRIRGLQAQNTKLHEICSKQRELIGGLQEANRELSFAMDSILAALAERYGDPEREGEELLGYRFQFPVSAFKTALEAYEVKSRKDEDGGMYVIGVIPRETPESEGGHGADE